MQVCKFSKTFTGDITRFAADTDNIYISCEDIINMDKELFEIKYENTAMYRRGYEIIKRNAETAGENTALLEISHTNGGNYES